VQASVGDRIHIHGAHVDDHQREGEIIEVRGEGGAPPYVVLWFDTDQQALVFPGPDAEVRPAGGEAQRDST
jgi:hypothetical protein